ncbi:uncharacterized protein LOC119832517 [Zerene cesonia]|uniref:uncharacterized protein LOC119832517 n=1 Tax=Zerene cesonia TaxID=33412 RepID=UPI0018E4E323|nr:uncharacterized protein LOC119832517 [Zerene cesonia]
MAGSCWLISFLLLTPIIVEAWRSHEVRRHPRGLKGDVHYHSKRHMLPREIEARKRFSTQTPKDGRKKPSGHLKPLNEDDMENDEVISVAVGPPAIRPQYEKTIKHPSRTTTSQAISTGTNIVKDVLTQLGREFLTHQVTEDFVFGQYIGNSMKNLTSDLKLKMQHEILELIVKYQKAQNGEVVPTTTVQPEESITNSILKEIKDIRDRRNETDEGWPDFSNLAKIVG